MVSGDHVEGHAVECAFSSRGHFIRSFFAEECSDDGARVHLPTASASRKHNVQPGQGTIVEQEQCHKAKEDGQARPAGAAHSEQDSLMESERNAPHEHRE